MSSNDGNDPNDSNRGASNGHPPKMMKKSSSMYLNIRMPYRHERPTIVGQDNEDIPSYGFADYDPTDKVQTLINNVRDPKHRTKHLFVEMDVLTQKGEDQEWREWARWVKYEEKVEDSGKRWSKPHVASLNMHFLMEIRKFLLEGVFLVDVECYSISQVVEHLLDAWQAEGSLNPTLRHHIRTLCLKAHRHSHERGPDKKKGMKKQGSSTNLRKSACIPRSDSQVLKTIKDLEGSGLRQVASAVSLSSDLERENSNLSLDSYEEDSKKRNERFLRKIPKGSEVANLMVAEVEELDAKLCGLIRLNDARILGDLTEVSLPTRFVFFLMGPKGSLLDCQEGGRCLATMLVDEVFREVAYKACNCDDLVAGIDEFLEQVTVLPPGEWDPKIRIEPPDKVPDQKFRKVPSKAALLDSAETGGEHEEEDEGHCDPDLVFSGRPFGGLVADIKRKIPWYTSDFTDALHIQCFASFVYIFLATLTPNVTFGGMLGKETDQYMGVMECIFAAAVTGVGFALFGGQPLNILGSTGPMLVLEQIIYNFCKDNEWDFLPFRFWIGMWTTAYLLVIVALDLSALVRYITRFTEESFASLIALIFIADAFEKLADIAREDVPLQLDPPDTPNLHCYCNHTGPGWNATTAGMIPVLGNLTLGDLNMTQCWKLALDDNSTYKGMVEWFCDPSYYVPDAFLLSVILFFVTFGVALFLVEFRQWSCFPSKVRNLLGDFAVLIAIIIAVGIDAALQLPTPKLIVPDKFEPTRSDVRDWIVNPMEGDNPWWLILAASIPALLSTILIFMDQQITAVIVNRKENKLKKGKGYHLDLLVLSVLVAIHSLLGLPWYVAATVSAIAHINSLKKQSETSAPGEKPEFLGVREQRVTALLVAIFSGAAVFLTNILEVIPMPVLYGVFLYMGFSALRGMQFIDRLLLMFMPVKYQPDHIYLRHVSLRRVHIFTLIQIFCLVALTVVKEIKAISIVFPVLVVMTGVVRKLLEKKFSQYELKYLDDILPSSKKDKKDDEKALEKASDAKISAIVANSQFTAPINNGSHEGGKASFFIDDHLDKPPAYDNKGFDTKL